MATLDLSGLANFSLTAGQLLVAGYDLWIGGPKQLAVRDVYLARTNTIRVDGAAPAIDVGDAIVESRQHVLSVFGQTNAIFADSMTVGHSKSTATLVFNPALAGSNPRALSGGNTNARVTLLTIGDDSARAGSGYVYTGTMNLSGGTVNAR